MTPEEAPTGTVVAIGVNGMSATKQEDGEWYYNLFPFGRVVDYDNIHKGGRAVYIPGRDMQVTFYPRADD